MTRHLARLIWNRRRRNALLAVEVFFSFLVLFAVALLGTQLANSWRLPLGFDAERLWTVGMRRGASEPGAARRPGDVVGELVAALGATPEIEAVTAANTAPYSSDNWGSAEPLIDGRVLEYSFGMATDEFAELLSLDIVAGRWFSREDDSSDSVLPVVVNRRFARELFGGVDPVGQLIPTTPDPAPDGRILERKRVVGVLEDYRKNGEFAAPRNFMFYRLRLDRVGDGRVEGPLDDPPGALLFRVAPGTTAAFEETILRRLTAVAPGWTFNVRAVDDLRREQLTQTATPVALLGTIAVFLLLMVGLGLTGVVWQNVTERTHEFGLRRAQGAPARAVRRQVLAELAMLASMALVPGVLLVAQLPLLPFPRDAWVFPPAVFAASIALSVGAIYLLTLLCGWYPSRLATRIEPAHALRSE